MQITVDSLIYDQAAKFCKENNIGNASQGIFEALLEYSKEFHSKNVMKNDFVLVSDKLLREYHSFCTRYQLGAIGDDVFRLVLGYAKDKSRNLT